MQYSAEAKYAMLVGQLTPNNVTDDAILKAVTAIPREMFVSEELAHAAYVDEEIAVGAGRFMLSPLTFARMVQLAQPRKADTVLDIGCATGYSTAVLAHLASKVYGLDEQREFTDKARNNINALNITNADVTTGSMLDGYPAKAPYNVILIQGGVQQIPSALYDQLEEGGRLVAISNVQLRPGQKGGLGKMTLFEKINGHLAARSSYDALVPLLPGFEQPEGFTF